MIPTKFQSKVKKKLEHGKNLLLITPTGLGKTFAAMYSIYLQYKYNIPKMSETTIWINYLKFADTCGK